MFSSLPPPSYSNASGTDYTLVSREVFNFTEPQGAVTHNKYVSEPLLFYHKDFFGNLDFAFFFLDFAAH
jgi:hypothetical protein